MPPFMREEGGREQVWLRQGPWEWAGRSGAWGAACSQEHPPHTTPGRTALPVPRLPPFWPYFRGSQGEGRDLGAPDTDISKLPATRDTDGSLPCAEQVLRAGDRAPAESEGPGVSGPASERLQGAWHRAKHRGAKTRASEKALAVCPAAPSCSSWERCVRKPCFSSGTGLDSGGAGAAGWGPRLEW